MTGNGSSAVDARLRRAATIVALANLAYFGVEFTVARAAGSVSLFADSIDFLEDAAVNTLVILAAAMSLAARRRVSLVLAVLLLVPTVTTAITAYRKFLAPEPPEPWSLSVVGLGALAVNAGCALLLARVRTSGSLGLAAFLSARNDVIANAAIIAAGFVTLAWRSGWPDLVVGVGIGVMNARAAVEVWEAARADESSAPPA